MGMLLHLRWHSVAVMTVHRSRRFCRDSCSCFDGCRGSSQESHSALWRAYKEKKIHGGRKDFNPGPTFCQPKIFASQTLRRKLYLESVLMPLTAVIGWCPLSFFSSLFDGACIGVPCIVQYKPREMQLFPVKGPLPAMSLCQRDATSSFCHVSFTPWSRRKKKSVFFRI